MSNETRDKLLTNRQNEILILLSDGLTNKEIAIQLNVTEGTVKSHIFSVFEKLGVNNRVKAIVKAREKHWI
jgi:DNA-binding NarL/FixJ family response regulator